jgi:predicted transcriptional regulator
MNMQPHFRTIGEITIANTLFTTEETPANEVAMKLLTAGFQGLPVLDQSGAVVGKVTEKELLNALKRGKDLKQTFVKEIMAPAPPVVSMETPLVVAMEIMERYSLRRLSVMHNGRFSGSVTRHDLLRAWLGAVWIDHDRIVTVIG